MSEPVVKATCETCQFVSSTSNSIECRRYAPVLGPSVASPTGWRSPVHEGVWPTTRLDAWCGEHPNRQVTPFKVKDVVKLVEDSQRKASQSRKGI